MATTSGTYNFSPSIADFGLQAFRRIQVFPPQITNDHLVALRMAANLILGDWSSNHGVNLAQVDQINIPLLPGVQSVELPNNTVELLDVYLRTFTANSATTNLGTVLAALGPPGNPLVATPFGDPALISPGSGTLSSTAGSELITLTWPSHGRAVGDPLFWGAPVSIGGLALAQFSIVSLVVDANTLQFYAPSPALETQISAGGTRLFYTASGSGTVNCILPGHGLSLGQSFTIGNVAVTVGGLTLPAGTSYTVTAVASLYQFSFAPGGTASSTAMQFENNGQINLTSQASSIVYTDVPLFPLSRNDWAAISYKAQPGRPTSFWYDRTVPPILSIYPVSPTGAYYGFMAYRLREIQDAVPAQGQTPDLPKRFFRAFVAALTMDMAEIWRPEMWLAKKAEAKEAWDYASGADTETVSTYIVPDFSGFYR